MLEAATAFPVQWAIGAKILHRGGRVWWFSPHHQHIPEKPDSLEGQKVSQAGDVDMMRLRLKVSTFTKRFAFRGPEPIYG